MAMSVIMMSQVSQSIFGSAPLTSARLASARRKEESTASVHVNISKGIHVRREEDPSPLSNAAVSVPTKGGEKVRDIPPKPEDGMDRRGGPADGVDQDEGDVLDGVDLTLKGVGARFGLGKADVFVIGRQQQQNEGEGLAGVDVHEENGLDAERRERREKEEAEDNYWGRFVGRDGPSQV